MNSPKPYSNGGNVKVKTMRVGELSGEEAIRKIQDYPIRWKATPEEINKHNSEREIS